MTFHDSFAIRLLKTKYSKRIKLEKKLISIDSKDKCVKIVNTTVSKIDQTYFENRFLTLFRLGVERKKRA